MPGHESIKNTCIICNVILGQVTLSEKGVHRLDCSGHASNTQATLVNQVDQKLNKLVRIVAAVTMSITDLKIDLIPRVAPRPLLLSTIQASILIQ